jgi:pimeloyl-ACP methyl ester carboxylesterase
VRALVLVSAAAASHASGGTSTVEARLLQGLSLPVVQPLAAATFSQAMRTYSAKDGAEEAFAPDPVDPGYERRLLSVTMRHDDLDALAGQRLAAGGVIDDLQAEDLREIDVPAVVIHGRDDRLVDARVGREIAAALPGARLELVSGGHMVPYVHAALVARAAGTCAGACGTH